MNRLPKDKTHYGLIHADLPKWKSQFLDGYSSVRRFNETLLERFETYRILVMLGWCLKNFDSNDLDANAKKWIEKTITYCESLINPQ
jgi:hypothetical protein